MQKRYRAAMIGGFTIAAAAALTTTATAGADTLPNAPFGGWGDCPISNPDTSTCVGVTVKGGTMQIGKLSVDVPNDSLRVAGGVAFPEDPNNPNGFDQVFVPPTDGSGGIYSKPINIPGGALGIDLPFNNLFGLNTATATVELAGNNTPSLDVFEQSVRMPVKLKIANPLLGNKCYLGSDATPVQLDLDVTKAGTLEAIPGANMGASFRNVEHAAEPFAVPAASGCGPFGVLNPIVNWRAGTPSPDAKNSLITTSDVFTNDADAVRGMQNP